MGSVFKKSFTKPLPEGAELFTKQGQRFARWRHRSKTRTAPVTQGEDGSQRIQLASRTYTAKYRNHEEQLIERPTGCRDEQSARQMLASWEREVDQIRAGTLDPKKLDTVQHDKTAIAEHLNAYMISLVAAGTTKKYQSELRRGVEQIADDCGFVKLSDVNRECVENWLAKKIAKDMSARTRNYYRESLLVFFN